MLSLQADALMIVRMNSVDVLQIVLMTAHMSSVDFQSKQKAAVFIYGSFFAFSYYLYRLHFSAG